jgi:hypothetical protein
MNTHLIDVAQILVPLPLLLCITIGWGRHLRSLLGTHSSTPLSFDDAWVGLVCITIVSEIFHFFLPINWALTLGISVLGLIFFLRIGLRQLLIELSKARNFIVHHPWACLAFLIACIAWISRSMDTVNNYYDTGLYHLQTIQWLNEYHIVKGLANLHGRLGFNQSYFSFVALLNAFPLWTKGYAIGNVFLLVLAVGTLFNAKFFIKKSGWWLLLSLSFGLNVVAQKIAAPSPDFAIGILQIVIFIKAVECLSEDNFCFSENIAVLLLLCAFILTVKLSAIIYGTSMTLAVLWICKSYFRQNFYLLLKIAALCLAIVLVHYSRGFFLSGFPFYPSVFLGLPYLPWSIPTEKAILEAKLVYSFAKNPLGSPDLVLGNWTWLTIWINKQSLNVWRFLGIGCALFMINLFLVIKTREYFDKKWLPIYIPIIASIVFWFLMAPDWRFLGAIPEIMITFSGWLCLRAIKIPQQLPKWVNIVLNKKILGMLIFLLTVRVIHVATLPNTGWQPWPTEEITQKYTETGLMVNTPLVGDRCWDAPIPCAAEFNPQLRLISPDNMRNSLSSGFSSKPR